MLHDPCVVFFFPFCRSDALLTAKRRLQITTEISQVAETCHCVSRSGSWIQINGHGDADLLAAGEETWGGGRPFALSRMEILRQGWAGEKAASVQIQGGLRHQEWVNAALDDG
eukprot:SAG31_NODE_26429_length_442_cov_1.192420_1_plen_112_part_10